ncbi:MAG TPA: hypothetical protein PLN31_02245 [Azoarcus taiwanensis]|uniref:Cell division protein ZapB n=1 Tax=Azoarcus taiwanensis TaxID=666964 RepID=A0A972J7J9_9RHOO|nr:hypothetical protein [Azoarcus taiwanensis]NMG02004.1 hypothetical protein [Azoarcus taiwanensis]HRQ56212.1 hypothetical protein [Azoarcus taiwanensis]
MDNELSRLEAQLEQLIGLYEAGKRERRELAERVVALEAHNRRLSEKVALATEKLETILERLPEA